MASVRWRVAITLEEYEVSDDPECDEVFGVRTLEDEEVGDFGDVREAMQAWAKAVMAFGKEE